MANVDETARPLRAPSERPGDERPVAAEPRADAPLRRARRLRVTPAGATLAGILLAGLALRLWGVRHGLPYVYNVDERAHFVRSAARYFWRGYDPHYFLNPPGYSYLLHVVYAFRFGGLAPWGAGEEVMHRFRGHPSELFVIGRVTAGVMGVAAAGVLYAVARRLYGAGTGLVAAALLCFCFLPVFYGHLALNDVPMLLPLMVGLLGTVRVYERGNWSDYALAGAGLGLATAFKYTAAALMVPIVLAYGLRVWEDRARRRPELKRLVGAGCVSLLAFVLLNPYAVLNPRVFLWGVRQQQVYAGDVGKLGIGDENGWHYYLWTLTWGFGWVPLALAAAGAFFALRRDWRKALLLLSFVLAFWLFMGHQTRFYGRWLLPVYPFLAILAGYGVVRLSALARPRWRTAAGVAIVAVALIQPVASVVHVNRVLSRRDTRADARAWLVAHLPRGQRPVVEKIASPGFTRRLEYHAAQKLWPSFQMPPGRSEELVQRLSPALIDAYAAKGFCVVVVGSIQRDRAFTDPASVPRAIAYYRRLETQATRLATFSPVAAGKALPRFNFDWSYDYYPGAYQRPGPRVDIYRLHNGLCRDQAVLRGEQGLRTPLPPLPQKIAVVPWLNPARSRARGDCRTRSLSCPDPWYSGATVSGRP